MRSKKPKEQKYNGPDRRGDSLSWGRRESDVKHQKANGALQKRVQELESMEALYYNEVKVLGRSLRRATLSIQELVEQVQVLAKAGAATAGGLSDHIKDCTEQGQERGRKLEENTRITTETRDHLASMIPRFEAVAAYVEPKVRSEEASAQLLEGIKGITEKPILRVIAALLGVLVLYLFGGKVLVAALLKKAFDFGE